MNFSDLKNDIAKVAPVLGTLIGGPAGAAVGALVSSTLGVKNTPEAIAQVLSDPATALKLQQLEISHAEFLANLASQESQGQLQIDDTEAKNTSVFVAGWRPAVGWSCAASFGYTFVLSPIIQAIVDVWLPHYTLPEVNTAVLMSILGAMLGLRTYEKGKGIDTKGFGT